MVRFSNSLSSDEPLIASANLDAILYLTFDFKNGALFVDDIKFEARPMEATRDCLSCGRNVPVCFSFEECA